MRWMLWGNLLSTLRKIWDRAVDLTLQYRRCESIVKITSWFQSCNNVVNTTFIVRSDLNLRSNVKTTVEQRNFDVVASKSLQRCVFVVRHCDLTTIVTTLCVCWELAVIKGQFTNKVDSLTAKRKFMKSHLTKIFIQTLLFAFSYWFNNKVYCYGLKTWVSWITLVWFSH